MAVICRINNDIIKLAKGSLLLKLFYYLNRSIKESIRCISVSFKSVSICTKEEELNREVNNIAYIAYLVFVCIVVTNPEFAAYYYNKCYY
jgi:hypothetical protein